ncbi:MAG: hypothetical protein ACJ788_18925 [Ktedonobacteraceae bacterium]
MQQCTSCGATLPPGANNCPACGAPTYDTGAFQETISMGPNARPDKSAQGEVYAPGSFQEAASIPPQAQADKMRLAGPYQPGSFQEAGSIQPAANPDQTVQAGPRTAIPPSASSGANYGQSAYPAPAQQPSYTVPQQGFPPFPQQPPPRKSGLSRGMTIAIAAAVLLLILSGVGLIYYSTVYRPAQLHMQATSTAQTILTQEARATAQANARATGTAIAIANATSTAQAVATANALATATALQNIYVTATRGTPALTDSLTRNSGSGWDEDQAQGGGGCAFSNGAYHASLTPKGYYFTCMAQNTNFSNFAFQVQMNIVRGDAGGFVFRANNSASKFYILSIGRDGTYFIAVSKDASHNTQIGYGQSTVFKQNPGQSNLLTIVVRGNTMYFYVNKQFAGSINDGTYKSGQIGLIVDNRSTSTDVAYTNAQVWKL